MKCTMKGGALYLRENIVMQIKGIFTDPEKNIFSRTDGYFCGQTSAKQIWIGGNEYYLTMKNSQNYLMEKQSGETVMELFHRGLTGGWNIDADNDFIPEIICGIFVFCRYIEQENEFLII